MAEAKTTDGYPRKPRTLDDRSWFYVCREGIVVVIDQKQTTIPWRKVEAAVRHYHAAKKS